MLYYYIVLFYYVFSQNCCNYIGNCIIPFHEKLQLTAIFLRSKVFYFININIRININTFSRFYLNFTLTADANFFFFFHYTSTPLVFKQKEKPETFDECTNVERFMKPKGFAKRSNESRIP